MKTSRCFTARALIIVASGHVHVPFNGTLNLAVAHNADKVLFGGITGGNSAIEIAPLAGLYGRFWCGGVSSRKF